MGTLPGPRLLTARPNPNELRISHSEMRSRYLVMGLKFRYAKSSPARGGKASISHSEILAAIVGGLR